MKIYPSTPLPGIRYKIELTAQDDVVVPYDYRFKLSGAIYTMVDHIDKEFGKVLHNRGFGREKFKFFTFSDVRFEKGKPTRGGIKVPAGSKAFFYFSTLLPRLEETIPAALFSTGKIRLGNAEFLVKGIRVIPVDFKENMYMKSISPIIVRLPVAKGEKLSSVFILPHEHPDLFEQLLTENIKRKVRAYIEYEPTISVKVDREYIRRKNQELIKKGEDPTVYFRKRFHFKGGFLLAAYVPLFLEGDVVAISMAYYAGIGHYNALGFGMIKEMKVRENRN